MHTSCLNFKIFEEVGTKYRIIAMHGLRVRASKELQSAEVALLPRGAVVTVVECVDQRCRIIEPAVGWLSSRTLRGQVGLEKYTVEKKNLPPRPQRQRAQSQAWGSAKPKSSPPTKPKRQRTHSQAWRTGSPQEKAEKILPKKRVRSYSFQAKKSHRKPSLLRENEEGLWSLANANKLEEEMMEELARLRSLTKKKRAPTYRRSSSIQNRSATDILRQGFGASLREEEEGDSENSQPGRSNSFGGGLFQNERGTNSQPGTVSRTRTVSVAKSSRSRSSSSDPGPDFESDAEKPNQTQLKIHE